MNTCFFNIATNLSFLEYHDREHISGNTSDQILLNSAIVKYRNHPSIKATMRVTNSNKWFRFDIVGDEKNF